MIQIPEGQITVVSTGQVIDITKSDFYSAIIKITNKDESDEVHFWIDGKYDGNSVGMKEKCETV